MCSATSNKKIVVGAEPSHFHQPVILYKYVGSRFLVVIIINNEIELHIVRFRHILTQTYLSSECLAYMRKS